MSKKFLLSAVIVLAFPTAVFAYTINPTTLTAGTVAKPYAQTFSLAPVATGTWNWTIASGTLPTGLSLTSQGLTAKITGTPNFNGTYGFTLKATKSTGTATSTSRAYSFVVNPGSSTLAISNVTVSGITTSTATVNWTTNVKADSQVGYSTSTLNRTWSPCCNPNATTTHSVTISKLLPATTYHYIAESYDGQKLVDSPDATFLTLALTTATTTPTSTPPTTPTSTPPTAPTSTPPTSPTSTPPSNPTSTGPNLIVNPNLASATVSSSTPDSWIQGGWGVNSTTFNYPVTGPNGAKAENVTISSYTSGDAKWYFNNVPVTAGATYTFSDAYNSTVASNLTAQFTSATGTLSYFTFANLPSSSGAWATTTDSIIVPTSTTALTVFHLIQAAGSLSTTNFSLTLGNTASPTSTMPTSTPPTNNLILNPTFAQAAAGNPNTAANWNTSGWGDASTAVFSYPVVGQDDGFAGQVSIAKYGTAGDGGSAEWYFNNVPVNGTSLYSFSDWYKSTATTYVIAQFTLSDNSLLYENLATLPSSTAYAHMSTAYFTPPSNAVSMTVLHLLRSAGTLAVDNYSLTTSTPSNAYAQGMVSLTFDDGWASQYDNALPILQAAGYKADFYIISNPTIDATQGAAYDIFTDPGEEIDTATTTKSAVWSEIYTDPDEATYRFSDTYTSTATSTVVASYTQSGKTVTQTIATLPAGTGKTFNVPLTLPVVSGATVTPIVITHSVTTGTLTATKPSLTEYQDYMTQQQVLALQSAGEVIGTHTEDHCDLTALEKNPANAETAVGNCPFGPLSQPVTAQTEISGARTYLNGIGATPDDTIAYPYGAYDAGIEQLSQADGFVAGRSIDFGYNTKTTDKYALKVGIVDASTTFATVKTEIDEAAANKVWLILLFHNIDPANVLTANQETDGTTPQILQQIVSYLKTSNVSVKTMDQALTAP